MMRDSSEMKLAMGSNWWGWISISLVLIPLVLMPVAFSWRIDADAARQFGLVVWSAGFGMGILGLWERGKARKLAAWGILLNVFVPPLACLFYVFYAMGALARSMGS